MPRETLRNQIDCVLSDIGADVVKTGMLPSAEVRIAVDFPRPSCSLRRTKFRRFVMLCCDLSYEHAVTLAYPCCSTSHLAAVAGILSFEATRYWGELRADPIVQVVEVVAEQCRAHKVSTLVVDPVLVSTSGHSLGDSEVASTLKERSAGSLESSPCLLCPMHVRVCLSSSCTCEAGYWDWIQYFWHERMPATSAEQQLFATCRLFPLATVITPNLAEAAALLDGRKICSIDDMKAAARELHALGPQYVLVKGGHLEQGEALQTL